MHGERRKYPLVCRVKGDLVTITVGIETIAKNNPSGFDRVYKRQRAFSDAVVAALQEEDKSGHSIITKAFEAAVRAARKHTTA